MVLVRCLLHFSTVWPRESTETSMTELFLTNADVDVLPSSCSVKGPYLQHPSKQRYQLGCSLADVINRPNNGVMAYLGNDSATRCTGENVLLNCCRYSASSNKKI